MGKKAAPNDDELIKSYGIRVSQPYGLFVDDVKNVILSLKSNIIKLTKINTDLRTILEQKDQEIYRLEQEIKKMVLEMSMLNVPDITQMQEDNILNEFKMKIGVESRYPSPPPEVAVPVVEIPEIDDSEQLSKLDQINKQFSSIEQHEEISVEPEPEPPIVNEPKPKKFQFRFKK